MPIEKKNKKDKSAGRKLFLGSVILTCLSSFVYSQVPFVEVSAITSTTTPILPQGMRYTKLFSEGDTVWNYQNKAYAAAKGNHDYNAFIPTATNEGLLYVGHETNTASDELGDGGGATLLTLQKKTQGWQTLKKENIYFGNVGGTLKNCSGFLTSQKKILSAEEFPDESNSELYKGGKGFRDTSDYKGMKRWQHMGWMVEVDIKTKSATQKLYKMGRFSHEAAWVMPDNKTVYLTDDYAPSVFFKFIAEKENDFTNGQLYAYAQRNDGGQWLPMPMHLDSLLVIRDVAIRRGATLFVRFEWITMVEGKLYISETGADDFSFSEAIKKGGIPAAHLDAYKTSAGYDYPYGSVLVFDPAQNAMHPYIKGGPGLRNPSIHFSNPDGITSVQLNGKSYLVINEDIIGTSKGRVSNNMDTTINEIWWLDMSIANPTSDDLKRFLVAPAGSETTGGYFSPGGTTYFVNIQHPDRSNPAPFNRSCTLAIEGFTAN